MYLTRVTVEDFRGYGKFELDLPAKPCVLILSGPNGLGKTSFFEAVEWALTGQVKRLDKVARGRLDPRDLARRSKNTAAATVDLLFLDSAGSATSVRRTQPVGLAAASAYGTPVADVAALLKVPDPRWSVTAETLANYLHLTHLHAQAAGLRFVTSEPKERWVRVSPLAGADRFEQVRTHLIASKSGLTRSRELRVQAMKAARAALDEWNSLLSSIENERALLAASEDAISPEQLTSALDELRVKLDMVGLASHQGKVAAEALSISLFRDQLRVEIDKVETRRGLLAAARSLPRQHLDLRTQFEILTRAAEEATKARNAAHKFYTERQAALQEASRIEQSARAVLNQALLMQTSSLRRVAEFRELGTLSSLIAESRAGLVAVEVRIAELEGRRQELTTRLVADDARNTRLAALATELAARSAAIESLKEVGALEERLRVEQMRSNALSNKLQQVLRQGQTLREEERSLQESLQTAQTRADAAKARIEARTQAVALLARALTEDDESCPVCQTRFEKRVLQRLALEAVAAENPEKATLEGELNNLQARLKACREAISKAQGDWREAKAQLDAINEGIAQIERRTELLRNQPLLKTRSVEELSTELTREQRDLASEADDLKLKVLSQEARQVLQRELEEATTSIAQRRKELESQTNVRTTLEARNSELQASVGTPSAVSPELFEETLVNEARSASEAVSKAREQLESAGASLLAATEAESLARQHLATRSAELERMTQQISGVSRSVSQIDTRFRELGVQESVSEASLELALLALETRLADLRQTDERLTELGVGLAKWQRSQSLRELEAKAKVLSGEAGRDGYQITLAEQLAAAERDLAVAQRARDGADQLSRRLNELSEAFGTRALLPFDALFQRYIKALLHDQRFHEIQAVYERGARGSALKFRVDMGSDSTDAEYILSEGQLGEVSLAAMLAANAAFPWSKWRALLLDDPMQYNDLIHVTSLFDVLRGLALFGRYQIVVSTHDLEQAAFFRRKLAGFGVEWVDCRFLGQSDEGLVVDVTRSTAARGASALATM